MDKKKTSGIRGEERRGEEREDGEGVYSCRSWPPLYDRTLRGEGSRGSEREENARYRGRHARRACKAGRKRGGDRRGTTETRLTRRKLLR